MERLREELINSWYAFDFGGNLVVLGDFTTEDEAFIKANEVEIEYNEPLHDVHSRVPH